jgi:hypothetical protein
MVSSMTLFRGMTSPKIFLQPILQQVEKEAAELLPSGKMYSTEDTQWREPGTFMDGLSDLYIKWRDQTMGHIPIRTPPESDP